MLRTTVSVALLACGALLAGCAATPPSKPTGPDHAQLQHALEGYLATQGNVCLAKFDWPIEVTERDFKRQQRDAIQMPVLEKLGLVTSTDATQQRVREEGGQETVPVKRYELTEAGRKYYLAKDSVTVGAGIEHHKDFCGAKLSLDKVVAWSKPTDDPNSGQVTLTYTFHVVPAEWATDPDAQRVFPMLARVIKGDGTMQLEQRMSLSKGEWQAVAPIG